MFVLKVTKSAVTILQDEDINKGEYNVTKCYFKFSKEYEGLVKVAVFFILDKKVKMDINDEQCDIPSEALKFKGNIEIGVFAYTVDQNNNKKLIYSPTPTVKKIKNGSFVEDTDNSEELSPTDKEQMNTKIQNNTNEIQKLKNGKVDKKQGYDLSENDFSNDYKSKLDNIEDSSQVNKIESFSVNGTRQNIDDNKNIDINVPTKTSELTNDSDFTTNEKLNDAQDENKSKFNNVVGNIRVVEQNVDSLETNQSLQEQSINQNITDINNLNVNINAINETILSIKNDLKNYYSMSETYSQQEINELLSSIPKFTIKKVDSLPSENISATTVYLIPSETNANDIFEEYIFVDNKWERLGTQKIDFSNFYTKSEVDKKINDLSEEFENINIDVTKEQNKSIIKITNKNGSVKTVEVKDGNCNFATFYIDLETGDLIMNKTDDMSLNFRINTDGYLEVIINDN